MRNLIQKLSTAVMGASPNFWEMTDVDLQPGADKDAFNLGTPATDQQRFIGTLTQTIRTRYGLTGAQAERLADFVLPDVLPLGDLSGFPNGRRLADDVIDVELGLIFGVFGPPVPQLQSDGVDANDIAFMQTFPFLAPPQT